MAPLYGRSLVIPRTLRPRGLVVSLTNFSREELGLDYSGGVGLTMCRALARPSPEPRSVDRDASGKPFFDNRLWA